MGLILDKIESKIEFYEAFDLRTLEKKMAEQIENNKALMLDVHAVEHRVTFDPRNEKMLYTAMVHYKSK